MAEAAWSTASRACEQVVVVVGNGGNTSAACLITDAPYYIARAMFCDFGYCRDDIDAAEISGSFLRLQHLHKDIEEVEKVARDIDVRLASVAVKVDGLAVAVATVDAKVTDLATANEALRALQCEVLQVLHTPDGRRSSSPAACVGEPGFPYDWPEK